MKTIESHSLNVAVIFPEDAPNKKLKQTYETLSINIDYPIRGIRGTVQIKVKQASSLHDILLPVSKAYEQIYQRAKEFGVWGHSINDLFFERVSINEDGTCEISIGS